MMMKVWLLFLIDEKVETHLFTFPAKLHCQTADVLKHHTKNTYIQVKGQSHQWLAIALYKAKR